VLLADNSPTPKNYKALLKRGINCIYVKPKQKVNQVFITESHNEIRKYAIRHGYDYILHLETDIIPPVDIIERLLLGQKQVISALYFVDEGPYSHLMVQELEPTELQYQHTRNVQAPFDILKCTGKVEQVYACGLGCILIHKNVFERIPFRWLTGSPTHADTAFALDLKLAGIPQWVDMSIICQHRNMSWALHDNVQVDFKD